MQHIDKIKTALGISGLHTRHFSFLAKATKEHDGAQIDLLIDRMDNVISICEVKFYNDEYVLNKIEAAKLEKKKSVFRQVSKTRKQLFIVLISTFGLKQNQHSLGLVDNSLTMDDLF